MHYHSHVDIFVNGKSEPVASSIGREDQSLFSPLHTHAASGLIHIEAPEEQDFTVEMLFTEWGVRMTNACIGGYCSPDTKLEAYVNGTSYTEPISTIVLKRGEEIAIVIGSPPATVPELGLSDRHRPDDREPGAVRRLRPAGPRVNRISMK